MVTTTKFFSSILSNDQVLVHDCQLDIFKEIPCFISEEMNRILSKIPSNEEVCVVIFSFKGN